MVRVVDSNTPEEQLTSVNPLSHISELSDAQCGLEL